MWKPTYFSTEIKEAITLIGSHEGMKALDIGAGLGKAMLSLQHHGFDAYGLEPSIPFYERAISQMGISSEKLKLGALEELDFTDESFDFITFGAVFEHLYNPKQCLEKALRWLKPGGVIQIEVPSADWFIPQFMNAYFKLVGTNYVTNLSPMHSPFHLHEFTPKTFQSIQDELGFRIVKQRYAVCDIYFIPKVFHPLLRWYMRKTNTGMQLTVYLRKNG